MTQPELTIADAIRHVTAAVQNAIDAGHRSRAIDADDLVEVLLAIADHLDPPIPDNLSEIPQQKYLFRDRQKLTDEKNAAGIRSPTHCGSRMPLSGNRSINGTVSTTPLRFGPRHWFQSSASAREEASATSIAKRSRPYCFPLTLLVA